MRLRPRVPGQALTGPARRRRAAGRWPRKWHGIAGHPAHAGLGDVPGPSRGVLLLCGGGRVGRPGCLAFVIKAARVRVPSATGAAPAGTFAPKPGVVSWYAPPALETMSIMGPTDGSIPLASNIMPAVPRVFSLAASMLPGYRSGKFAIAPSLSRIVERLGAWAASYLSFLTEDRVHQAEHVTGADSRHDGVGSGQHCIQLASSSDRRRVKAIGCSCLPVLFSRQRLCQVQRASLLTGRRSGRHLLKRPRLS
jgi:hypothetical protein